MSKILKKQIYEITFTLASPLAIGSGRNDVTDKDIVCDGEGKPYIPASSIAGVCKSMIDVDEKIWGKVEGEDSINSSIIFYDGQLLSDYNVTVRDSVALDEYKTAKTGAKFDMEVVETGAKFRTFIEQSYESNGDENIAYNVAQLFLNNQIKFGGKTTRGYGDITVDTVKGIEVIFSKSANASDKVKTLSVDEWLDFDLFDSNNKDIWKTVEKEVVKTKKNTTKLLVGLELVGGISIRRYVTDAYDATTENSKPDFVQLSLKDNTPVVPGTSWAGAFEHHMRKLLGEKYDRDTWEKIFGVVDAGREVKKKSEIIFSESQITGGTSKIISRNAIDRFTGGTSQGALFTEQSYFGGNTELKIEFTDSVDKDIAKALVASLVDLSFGILAVGGETSIGRGQFTIKSINNETVDNKTPQELYESIMKNIPVKEVE